MNLHCYEYEKYNKIINDDIHEFCLCERVNEEYMRRSLIKNIRNNDIAKERKSENPILYIKSNILHILKRWELNVQNSSNTK